MRLPLQLSLPIAVLAPVLLVAMAGCGAGAPVTMVAPGMTSIAFVDPDTLQPILDGQGAQVIHGPQGGYHILVSLLAHGIWPGTPGIPGASDDPVTALRAFHATGDEVTLTIDSVDTLHIAYMTAGDGVALVSRQLRLAIHSPSEIARERLLLHVDVIDRDGRAAKDEKHVIAIPPTM